MANTDHSIGKQLERAVNNNDLAAVKGIRESERFNINATLIEWLGGHCTVLWWAVRENKVPIAKYLLTLQQLDVNVPHTYWRSSPLHVAVRNNSSELAALLLQRGANLYQESRYGNTPLVWAAREGHREAGEVLVSGPVKALLEATEEGDTLTATTELIRMYNTTLARYRAAVTTFIVETEMERMRRILSKNSKPETSNSELREASSRLLNIISGASSFDDQSSEEAVSDDSTGSTSSSTTRQPPVNTLEEQQPELKSWFTSKSFILTMCIIVLIVTIFMSFKLNSSISASLKIGEYNDKICSSMSSLDEFVETVDFHQGMSVNLFYIDDRIEVRIKASTIECSLEQLFYRRIYGWQTKQEWHTELMFCDKSVSSEHPGALCVKDKLKAILHKLYGNAKIKMIAVFKAPLNPGSISTEEIAEFFWPFQRQWLSVDYHAFLVFCTNDERWWSLEKNSKGIHIIMNRHRESVVYEYDSEPRPTPIDRLVEDESNYDLAHLFSMLLGTRSSYNLIYSNCKDFCKLVFDKLAASTKSYVFTSPKEYLSLITLLESLWSNYIVVFCTILLVFLSYIFYTKYL